MLLFTGGRRLPCFFILAINVVGFMPNFAAEPYGPPMIHPVASNAAQRSKLSVKVNIGYHLTTTWMNISATGPGLFCRTSPRD
jgi:hypothetical protein